MTKETLEKMPSNIVGAINSMKDDLNGAVLDRDCVRNMIYGYTKGLRDAGIITDQERRILYIYATL